MIAGQIEIQLMANIARLQRDMDRANRLVGDATASMGRAADAAKAALAGIAAGIGLGQIAGMVDEYAKFTAQLRLATQSQREYAAAYGDVKRIATQSTQGLAETGVLYARIANGTRQLGVSQKEVAAITETVNLSLLVSGATASESASAQLQLAQAFASGTLRGEEFNAVNEAAPRLMKALADGMGMPVGALKKMAEEGKITSAIMSQVLPDALGRLREEAKEIQTISGAFTVLKNNVMEFVGVQANASGAVAFLTGAIGSLASNLGLLAGVLATLATAKVVTMLADWGTSTYRQVTANTALRASTLASAVSTTQAAATTAAARFSEAQANARASAAALNLANARVQELRAAVLAARGANILEIATNGLIPAEARAAAMARTHAAALSQMALAGNAATVSSNAASAAITAQAAATGVAARAMGMLRGVMGMFGGPLGFIITLLGIAATAWMTFGKKAEEGNKQAVESYEEAHERIVKGLDEQIEKNEKLIRLKNLGMSKSEIDRDLPVIDQMAAASKRLADINSKSGEFALMGSYELLKAREAVMKNIVELTEKMQKNQATGAAADAQSTKDRVAALMKEYATKDEQRDAEIKAIEDLKGKTELYETLVARIRAKYADKGAAAGIQQEASAYQTLMASIGEKIAANKLELDGYNKLSESQKMTIKLDESIANGKNILSTKHIEEARAKIAVVAVQEEALRLKAAEDDWAKKSSAANADNLDSLQQMTVQLQAEALAQQEQNDRMGLGAVALAELDAQRLEHLATIKDENAAIAEAIDWTGAMSEQYRAQAQALRDRATAARAGATKGQNVDLTRAKELLDIMSQVDEATKSAAASMTDSFGRVGTAIGGLTTALSGYARQQAAIAAQLAAVKTDKSSSPERIAKAEIAAAEASAQARVKSYGDMASAAKSFFDENSTGYKVMEGAEKAFRAAEMAMAVEAMVKKIFFKEGEVAANVALNATKLTGEAATSAASTTLAATEASAWGITAVVKALASLPFPANLAAGAATLAAVVAIGAKLIGGGISGSGGETAAKKQERQGSGSVFGDVTAKSDSILQSLEMLESHSDDLIPINLGMLTALRNIEASMSGLTNLVIRSPGVIDGSNLGIQTGTISRGMNGMAGQALDNISKIPVFGGLLAKGGKFWGNTKQNIVDSGIQFGGSIRDLQGGAGFEQYASVDTVKKSWFGLSKKTTNSVQTAGLDGELAAQMGMIFAGLDQALTAAAVGMGVGADRVKAALDAMVVETTQISLKDLKGEDLTAALNAVISKTMDDMATAVFPEFDRFRQVGEGYAETVLRVAANYARLDGILNTVNGTFGSVGLGSLGARERLIQLSGGLDAMEANVSGFAENFLTETERLAPVQRYVTEQLAELGFAGLNTRDAFKDAVTGLMNSGALATEAGAKTFAGLLQLQDAFSTLYPENDEALSQRASLMDQLNDLTMTSAQLRAKEREAIDESNRALFDSITAIQGYTEQRDQAKSEADRLASGLAQIMGTVDQTIQDTLRSAMTALDSIKSARTSVQDAIRSAQLSSMTPEARLGALRAREAALFGQLDTAADPAAVAAQLQTVILDRIKEEVSLSEKLKATSTETIKAQISGFEKLKSLAGQIAQFTASLKFGDLSPLSNREQLDAAKALYERTAAAAERGDADAAGNLTGNLQAYLQEAKGYFASSAPYADIFQTEVARLEALGLMNFDPQIEALNAQLSAIETVDSSVVQTGELTVTALGRLESILGEQQSKAQAAAEKAAKAAEDQVTAANNAVARLEALIEQSAAIANRASEQQGKANSTLAEIAASAKMAEAK